jgi:sporulation protein YlmC with PRC-barrel domain
MREVYKGMGVIWIVICVWALIGAVPVDAQQQRDGRDGRNVVPIDDAMLDMPVQTRDGEEAGEIEDVIFDRQGRITTYFVDLGGRFLGIGGKMVAVSSDRISFVGRDYAIFQGTSRELENQPEVAPTYRRGAYYGYYGPGRPYYGPYSRGYYGPYGPGAMGGYPGPEMQREEQERLYQGERNGDPSHNLSADFFLGARVRNRWNAKIGEIEDLLADPATGRITHAVVEVDDPDKEVVVPFMNLRLFGPNFVYYRGTERQLAGMPEYREGRQLPRFDRRQTGPGRQGPGNS